MIKYSVTKPDGTRTSFIGLARARRKVRSQAKKFAGDKNRKMRLKRRGDEEYGHWRESIADVMSRWETLIKTSQPSDIIILDIDEFPYSIKTRIHEVSPPAAKTVGNSRIDQIHGFIVMSFKGHSGGICARRYISGTTTPTQHNPWINQPDDDDGSNAEDWFAYPDNMETLYEQMYDLAQQGKTPNGLPIGRIIVGQKQWTPDEGWHYSGAEFHRHGHIEGRPSRSGARAASC